MFRLKTQEELKESGYTNRVHQYRSPTETDEFIRKANIFYEKNGKEFYLDLDMIDEFTNQLNSPEDIDLRSYPIDYYDLIRGIFTEVIFEDYNDELIEQVPILVDVTSMNNGFCNDYHWNVVGDESKNGVVKISHLAALVCDTFNVEGAVCKEISKALDWPVKIRK